MSDGQTVDPQLFKEAVHYWNEALCKGCQQRVDLRDAENFEEGKEIWKEHIKSNCEANVVDGLNPEHPDA